MAKGIRLTEPGRDYGEKYMPHKTSNNARYLRPTNFSVS